MNAVFSRTVDGVRKDGSKRIHWEMTSDRESTEELPVTGANSHSSDRSRARGLTITN